MCLNIVVKFDDSTPESRVNCQILDFPPVDSIFKRESELPITVASRPCDLPGGTPAATDGEGNGNDDVGEPDAGG